MRNVNAIAYTFFSENLNVAISPEALEKLTEIQGAGGHSAIVRVMRDLGLNVVTLKSGRDVISHTCLSRPAVEPKEVAHHYAKAAKRNSPATAPQIATSTENVDLACMSDDYNQTCKLLTFETQSSVEPDADLASDQGPATKKRIRKSRAKKLPVRELEMHE